MVRPLVFYVDICTGVNTVKQRIFDYFAGKIKSLALERGEDFNQRLNALEYPPFSAPIDGNEEEGRAYREGRPVQRSEAISVKQQQKPRPKPKSKARMPPASKTPGTGGKQRFVQEVQVQKPLLRVPHLSVCCVYLPQHQGQAIEQDEGPHQTHGVVAKRNSGNVRRRRLGVSKNRGVDIWFRLSIVTTRQTSGSNVLHTLHTCLLPLGEKSMPRSILSQAWTC